MKGVKSKLILLSFLLALLATIGIFLYLNSLKGEEKVKETTTILVATDTIPPRTLIDEKMIKEIQVQDTALFGDYINVSKDILGKYAKQTIFKNEPFMMDKLINEDDKDLAIRIPKEHRAISLNMTGDGGVAKLIKPGDFVDVVLYLSEKKENNEVVREALVKIISQNIQVLGIDNDITRVETSEEEDKEEEKGTFLVTLAVPTKELEKLTLGEYIGSLKLALRPLKDNEINDEQVITWEELIGALKEKVTSPPKENEQEEQHNPSETKENYTNYKVKEGDTLRGISREFYGDAEKYVLIREANSIKDENYIESGQVLKIPKVE